MKRTNTLLALAVGSLFLAACSSEVDFKGASADQRSPEVVIDQEFPAALLSDTAVSFNPTFGLVQQRLQLKEKDPQVAVLHQADRPAFTDAFQQGHDGDSSDEEYEVSKAGLLDLLVVVDDSGSMVEEQANLAPKLANLLKYIDKTDWQINVVTTTSSCRRNDRIIKKGDADANDAFKLAVQAGIYGSGDEAGIYMALRALQGQCETGSYSWLRPDSSLAVLFLSDEESYCATADCAGWGPNDLIDKMKELRPANPTSGAFDKLRAYGLTWDTNDSNCTNINGETPGLRYRQVISAFGGINSSICQADYSNTLDKISLDVSRIIKYEYDLKYTPDMNSVKVKVVSDDGSELAYNDYEIVGNKLKLKGVTGAQLKMKVSYRYDAKPRFEEVTISAAPDAATIEAIVDNKLLDPSKYTFDPSTLVLHFNERPADRADVKVKFRKNDVPLQKSFDVMNVGLRGSPVKVEVNGTKTDAYTFDQGARTIEFAKAPADNAEIRVSYRTNDDRITEYNVAGVDPQALKEWALFDAGTGEVLAAGLNGGKLTVNADDVVDGRDVVLKLNYGDKDDVLGLELPSDPVDGTLHVEALSGASDCAKNISVEGRKVRLNCDAESLDRVVVSYRYVVQQYVDFTVTGTVDGEQHWQVFVDGAAIGNFVRNGNTVTISKDLLQPDSTVRIIVTRVFVGKKK